jgi:hypothetical protein
VAFAGSPREDRETRQAGGPVVDLGHGGVPVRAVRRVRVGAHLRLLEAATNDLCVIHVVE